MRWAKDLAAMIQVSLIGYAVGGAFLGLAYFDIPYLLVAFVVILKLVVHETLQAETNPSKHSDIAPSKFSFGPRKKSEPIT